MSNLKFAELYSLIRKRIEHSDGLLHQRLTWWSATQGVLYTAFIKVWFEAKTAHKQILFFLVSLGVSVTVFIFLSIIGHFLHTKDLGDMWDKNGGSKKSPRLDDDRFSIFDYPDIRYKSKIFSAKTAAYGLLVISLVAWLFLAVCAYKAPLAT